MRGLIDNVFQAFGVHDPVPFLLVAGGFLLGTLLVSGFSWQRRRGAEDERNRGANVVGSRVVGPSTDSDHHYELQSRE